MQGGSCLGCDRMMSRVSGTHDLIYIGDVVHALRCAVINGDAIDWSGMVCSEFPSMKT